MFCGRYGLSDHLFRNSYSAAVGAGPFRSDWCTLAQHCNVQAAILTATRMGYSLLESLSVLGLRRVLQRRRRRRRSGNGSQECYLRLCEQASADNMVLPDHVSRGKSYILRCKRIQKPTSRDEDCAVASWDTLVLLLLAISSALSKEATLE